MGVSLSATSIITVRRGEKELSLSGKQMQTLAGNKNRGNGCLVGVGGASCHAEEDRRLRGAP